MNTPGTSVRAFTTEFPGLVAQLVTPVHISLPFDNKRGDGGTPPQLYETKALWDTGATNSVITAQTAAALNLRPISMINVNHAGGVSAQNVYLVNIYLPSQVAVAYVQVTECQDISGSFGAIIGMDIIMLGDFSVTNYKGKTVLSYRTPSLERTDFVKAMPSPIHINRMQDRNEKCNCGSGKKFKYCCGKP